MDKFISFLGGVDVQDPVSTSSTTMNVNDDKWCDACRKAAQEENSRYARSMEMVKKKIMFTDNLIKMFTQTKASLEELQNHNKLLEQESKRKDVDNQLVQTQLRALLADKRPSQLEVQKDEIALLKQTNENLNDQIKSMDMTRKMLEDKIESMREEVMSKDNNWKKHNKEKDQLLKESIKLKKNIHSLEKDNLSLNKKIEVLHERLRKRRYRGSGSFSQTTDSEHNITIHSDDVKKSESEDTHSSSKAFKSPGSERKKRTKKKHQKREITDGSEDEQDKTKPPLHKENLVQINSVFSDEHEMSAPPPDAMKIHENRETDQDNSALTSDDNNLGSPKHGPHITNAMKARILETKTKRAVRNFLRRPNSSQLREMSGIVKRLHSENASVDMEIHGFCKKHSLLGHESQVARKIIKVHQESLESSVCALLQSISDSTNQVQLSNKETDKQIVSGLSASVKEATAEDEPIDKPNTCDMSTAKHIDEVSKAHDTFLVPVESTAMNEMDDKDETVEIPVEETVPKLLTDLDASMEYQEVPDSLPHTTSMFSSDDENDDFITANIQPVHTLPKLTSPSKTVLPSPPRMRTRSLSKCLSEKSDAEVLQQASKQQHNRSLSISSADGDLRNISISPPQKTQTRRMRTRSISKSISEFSDSGNSKDSIVVSPSPKKNSKSDFTSKSADVLKDTMSENINSTEELLKHVAYSKPVQEKCVTEIASRNLASVDCSTVQSKCATNELLRKRKRSSNSPQQARNIKRPNTLSLNVHVDDTETVVGEATSTTFLTKSSKDSDDDHKINEEIVNWQPSTSRLEPLKNSKAKHPVLSAMKSLPFTIGHESPNIMSSTMDDGDFSFLPPFEDNILAEDLSSDGDFEEESSFLVKSLDGNELDSILECMRMDNIIAPLSPLNDETVAEIGLPEGDEKHNSPDGQNDNDQFMDEHNEEENRQYISPSANLCTAFSFSATPVNDKPTNTNEKKSPTKLMPQVKVALKRLNKDVVISSNYENKKHPLQGIRDTPRRFSCEAPVLARPVPSIKPVMKTQSLDPALLRDENLAAASKLNLSGKAFPFDDAAFDSQRRISIESGAMKLQNTHNLLTHTSSGPFKVVTPSSSPPGNDNISYGKSPDLGDDGNDSSTCCESRQSAVSSTTGGSDKLQESGKEVEPKPADDEENQIYNAAEMEKNDECDNEEILEDSVDIDAIVRSLSMDDAIGEINFEDAAENDKNMPSKSKTCAKKKQTKTKLIPLPTSARTSNLPLMLEDIQSAAMLDPSCKLYAKHVNIPHSTVLSWIAHLLSYSVRQEAESLIKHHIKTQDSLEGLEVKDVLHDFEYDFVRMVTAVDQVRSKHGNSLTGPVVLPSLLRVICRYGNSLHHFDSMESNTFHMIKPLLDQHGVLEICPTLTLVRVYSALCKSVGNARGVLDLCRYAQASKSSQDTNSIFFNCVLCYPEAFSNHLPLSGKIVLFSIMFQIVKMERLVMDAAKNTRNRKSINSLVQRMEQILGWTDEENSFSNLNESELNMKWQAVLNTCLSRISSAQLVKNIDHSSIVTSQSDPCVVVIKMDDIDDVYSTLEMLTCVKGLIFATHEIIEIKFWPWLNAWSRHLVVHDNKDEDKEVTDACMMAVLHGLTILLMALMTKQQVLHPKQPVINQAISYFQTICSLLANFTLRYMETAPHYIQCATALTVLSLSFCKPQLAFTSVHDWLVASRLEESTEADQTPTLAKKKGKKKTPHRHLAQLVALYPEKKLRKLIMWLEAKTKLKRRSSTEKSTTLSHLLWG